MAPDFAPVLTAIASAEGPNMAWLRSQGPALDQIKREREAEEAERANDGGSCER